MQLYLHKPSLLILIMIVNSCIFVSCKSTYDNPVKQQPVSEAMLNTLLRLEDIPELPQDRVWESKKPNTIIEGWTWSNPINIVTQKIRYGSKPISAKFRTFRPIVTHTLIQYPSEDKAIAVWKEQIDDPIIYGFSLSVIETVPFLLGTESPSLDATNVLYRCEEYYSSCCACTARLQYSNYYTQLAVSDMEPQGLSTEQFYTLVKIVDERMQTLIEHEALKP